MLLFLIMIATAILFIPLITSQIARQSSWLVYIVSTIAGITVLWITKKLGERFPRLTISKYSQIILGKYVGKAFAFLYIVFFLVVNILVLREASEFLVLTVLEGTPIIVLNAVLVLISFYAAAKGIEVIARMTQFVLPLFLLAYGSICLLSVPNANVEKILPLLEGGVSPIIRASFVPAAWYGEIVVLAMLIPIVNKPQEVMKKSIWAIGLAGLFLTAGALVALTVLGPDISGVLVLPFWFLAKTIEYGNYIQRLESIILPLLMTGIIIKTSLFFHLICLATTEIIGVKYDKWVSAITLLLSFAGATFLIPTTMMLIDILSKFWPPFALFFELFIPLFLLLVAFLRKKKGVA